MRVIHYYIYNILFFISLLKIFQCYFSKENKSGIIKFKCFNKKIKNKIKGDRTKNIHFNNLKENIHKNNINS